MKIDYLLAVLEGYKTMYGDNLLVEINIDEKGNREPLICTALDKRGMRRVLFL